MPKLYAFIEITEEEKENFLTRLAGGAVLANEIDRKLTTQIVGDDEEIGETISGLVDKFGVTWDARFHGVAKNTNKDGSWKRTKGLSDAVKAEADAYEAAQKAAFNAAPAVTATTETAAAPVTLPTTTETAPAVTLPGEPAAAAPVVGMPGMPGAELPMPTAEVAPAPISYEEVVEIFQKLGTAKPAVAANWQAIYADAGIADPQSLKTDESARRRLADQLNKLLAA